ncbi:MAG: hypothetical protein C4582_13710 [Desulfobacteraceae bacterium]|nr:MAG: hypothetical protein C4582_13710 [Desulfobacteraceae bacterium]
MILNGVRCQFLGLALLLSALMLQAIAPFHAFADEARKDSGGRGIFVAPEYTGVVIPKGQDLSLDLTIKNKGKQDELVELKLTAVAQGWKANLKSYSYGITGTHVEAEKSKSITLRLEPDGEVPAGQYAFAIAARTQDGALTSSCQVIVTVEGKGEETKPRGVNIATSYPVLSGPTDGKFEFSLEVESKLGKEGIFNLSAQAPEKWEINFKPAYDDKLISSLRLKPDQSQTVAVEVKPYPFAKPGQYPIGIKVSSPEAKGEAELTVVLKGIQKLDAGTINGLLSLPAVRGRESTLSFYIKNSGSATLTNIQLLSFKPENWKVKFEPERIDVLEPDQLKQIEVVITPAENALVGDYSVGLSAESGRVSKTIELRVTVQASTIWGWVGIGIIILVLFGLVALFVRLGRR